MSGGNSFLEGSLQSHGAGTQSGSTLKDRGSDQRKVDQAQFVAAIHAVALEAAAVAVLA